MESRNLSKKSGTFTTTNKSQDFKKKLEEQKSVAAEPEEVSVDFSDEYEDNDFGEPFGGSQAEVMAYLKRLEDDNLFKKGLTKALKQMLEEKILNSKIKYGSENFFISLDEQIHSDIETNTLCFQGQIYSTLNMKFIYCSSDEENSLLIID